MTTRRTSLLSAVAATAVLVATAGSASAAFAVGAVGVSAARAATMPSGPAPTVTVAGISGILATYSVTFPAVAVGAPSPTPVTSYAVQRLALGNWTTPGGTCASSIAATTPAPAGYSCSETLLLSLGQPRYRVVPTYQSWVGLPGPAG